MLEICLIAAIALLSIALFRRRPNGLHARNIAASKRILNKLDAQQRHHSTAQTIAYLRKIDPLIFEELILTALYRRGAEIKRNRRYTGDNGIDGQCRIASTVYLIQCKRYTSSINPRDVKSFATICNHMRRKGLFIHTGRTGPKSRSLAHASELHIISGETLVNLILGKQIIVDDHHLPQVNSQSR